jgi:hypothetical protein
MNNQWLAGIVIAIVLFGGGYWMGNSSKTIEVLSSPSKTDTIIVQLPPIIKWLKPDNIYKVPDSTMAKIDSLSNDVDSLRNKIVELSEPYSTKMDSLNFSLFVLSHPYEKVNEVTLQLNYSQLTKTVYVPVAKTPWWTYPVISAAGILGFIIGSK